ncbi:MAG: hypothetical protein ACRDJN_16255, partial [Chloroflexota bacterium]
APVVAATAGALLFQRRHTLIGRLGATRARLLAGGAALGAFAAYLVLLGQHPTTSWAASAAHFWPQVLARGPLAYLQEGGMAESFRTFWYAYDYAVRWPARIELALAGVAIVLTLAAMLGLIATAGRPLAAPPAALGVLWLAAGAQIVSVIGRFGFSEVLGNEMGGAAQAKAFFPAVLPLALLLAGGLAAAAERIGLRDRRWPTIGLLVTLLALDGVSLAVTLWHHYRWWQVGL